MVAYLGWLCLGGSRSLWRRGGLSERGLSRRLAATTPYLRLCAIRLSWERLPFVERRDGARSRCKSYTHTAYVQFGFANSHFSQRDHIEGCKRRECFHLDNPGGSALLSRRQTGNWTPMAAIRLCTSQCP